MNEETLAGLCLLTRIAWHDGLPSPMTRPMVHRLIRAGALRGLTLRRSAEIPEAILSRAEALLSRSAEAAVCLENYAAQGYQVLLTKERMWPAELACLGDQQPLFLFVKGNIGLLSSRKVAIAGSREIMPDTVALSKRIGKMAVGEGLVVVTGGARGVDAAAQQAALEADGSLILVPAQPVNRLLQDRVTEAAYKEGRLLFLCDALPDEPFSAQKALTRNHTIYALGEAAIVVASRDGMGGSWRGAKDCLSGGYSPVWTVAGSERDFSGNRSLISLGAKAFDAGRSISTQCFPETARQMNMFEAE